MEVDVSWVEYHGLINKKTAEARVCTDTLSVPQCWKIFAEILWGRLHPDIRGVTRKGWGYQACRHLILPWHQIKKMQPVSHKHQKSCIFSSESENKAAVPCLRSQLHYSPGAQQQLEENRTSVSCLWQVVQRSKWACIAHHKTQHSVLWKLPRYCYEG